MACRVAGVGVAVQVGLWYEHSIVAIHNGGLGRVTATVMSTGTTGQTDAVRPDVSRERREPR